MTIEEAFFKTFGIEPKVESIEFVIDFDGEIGQVNEQKPNFTYPKITDRVLLELICLHSKYCEPKIHATNLNNLKEQVLDDIMTAFEFGEDELKHQVQALFEGGENEKI